MKKIIALLLVLVMTLAVFTSCSPKGKTLDDVKAAGKLYVATNAEFPPFEMFEGENVVGIEIDILELICAELGVELVVEHMDFDSVLVGIQAAKYDCAASGITVTEKREKNMLFTTPYCMASQCIVVKEGSSITTAADLEGKKVSVQTGTTAEEYCNKELGSDYVLSLPNNVDAKSSLATGRVDAWIVDNLTAFQMIESGDGMKMLDVNLTEEPYAFAFAFGSETLVAEMDRILKKLIDDGTIKSIFDSYGVGSLYIEP